MLERISRKIEYVTLLFQIGGLGALLHQLRRQLYSREDFLRLEKNLKEDVQTQCSLKYDLSLATEEEIKIVLEKAKTEGKNSVHDLIQRYWFYQSGFHNCYIGRIDGTGDICHVTWLIFSDEEGIIQRNFKERLPTLASDECLLENVYTVVRYRGKGLMSSAIMKLSDLARERGCKRMITYVRKDNLASLKACQLAGFKICEDTYQLKFFFFTLMRHNSHKTKDGITYYKVIP